MEEEKVSAEEMTEQETSDFEEAFSEADEGEESGEEETPSEDSKSEEEEEKKSEETPETEEDGSKEEEIQEDKKEPQTIVVNGKEYTQEEIAQRLSEPRYEVVERMAKDAGQSVEEYLKDVDERYTAGQVESRTAQLVEQGLDESLAKHVAETEMENAKFKAGAEQMRKAEERQKETQSQAEARMKAEIADFNRIYPEVKEIPPEVLSEISKTGHSPVVAYQNYLLHKQEAELKALKQSKKNKESTPGSVKGTKAGEKDEFGEAFMAAMKD